MGRGRCPVCGAPLIWQNDFSGEDVGYSVAQLAERAIVDDENVIVSLWECSINFTEEEECI